MTYQTPELIAKQIINRLATSQLDGTAVWIYTAHLSPENRHPRKMNMLAHLLLPLTQNNKCRPFFLSNNDILLVGAGDLSGAVLPFIDQMRGVLSDDPFIQQNTSSFFTVFNLKDQRELLLSALSTLPSSPTPSQDLPEMYPLVQNIFKKKDLTDFLRFNPVIHLTPTLKKHTLTVCLPDTQALLKTAVTDTSLLCDWMQDAFKYATNTHLLETFVFLNEIHTPILLPVNAADIASSSFDFFTQRRKTPTAFLFTPTDLLDEKTLEAAQKKCHSLRYKWGFILDHVTQLSLIDFSKTGPDFVVLPGTDLTPDMLPKGLKKETVLLTHIDTDTTLFNALRSGFSLFCGPLITSLIAASCQGDCPYGDTCTSGTCTRIHAGKILPTACAFPTFRKDYVFCASQGEK